VLMYSSGTTGASKGVCVTAENLLTGVATFVAEFAPDAGSRSLVPPPYYHIAASGWSLIALSVGGQVVQVREPRPVHLLELMHAHATTHAALVPAIISLMVELPQARTADFSALRTVVYGSSPIAPGLLRRAVEIFGADFTQSYGLTETVGVGTLLRPDDHRSADPGRLRSAGRAAAGVEVAVVDPVTGAPRPAGQTGEVVLRGRNVTPGYWRRPEATAAMFLPGGWLRTGDAGQLDAGGYLTIADRIKDIIISGGENIIPGEVERVSGWPITSARPASNGCKRCPGTRRARCCGDSSANRTGSTVTARSGSGPTTHQPRPRAGSATGRKAGHDREPVG
jgi:acyl-CoA synthetase (AMP-forming)/AMP-acid ligase II